MTLPHHTLPDILPYVIIAATVVDYLVIPRNYLLIPHNYHIILHSYFMIPHNLLYGVLPHLIPYLILSTTNNDNYLSLVCVCLEGYICVFQLRDEFEREKVELERSHMSDLQKNSDDLDEKLTRIRGENDCRRDADVRVIRQLQ